MKRTLFIPLIDGLGRYSFRVSSWLNVLGKVALVILFLFVITNVVMRYVFKDPLPDSIFLPAWLLGAVIMLGLPRTTATGGHIDLGDILLKRFSRRQQAVAQVVVLVITLACAIVLTLAGTDRAVAALHTTQATDMLKIRIWPFRMLFAIGGFVVCFVVLAQLLLAIACLKRATGSANLILCDEKREDHAWG